MPGYWDTVAALVDRQTVLAAVGIALIVAAYVPRQTRALALWVAQYAAFVALVLGAAIAGRQGFAIGEGIGRSYGLNELGQFYASIAGAIAGGLAGFTAASLTLAVFFVLLEIRDNTKD
jgi:outer membrane lipoprotein SlyB